MQIPAPPPQPLWQLREAAELATHICGDAFLLMRIAKIEDEAQVVQCIRQAATIVPSVPESDYASSRWVERCLAEIRQNGTMARMPNRILQWDDIFANSIYWMNYFAVRNRFGSPGTNPGMYGALAPGPGAAKPVVTYMYKGSRPPHIAKVRRH